MLNPLSSVQLKPREERRIQNGHLWIYSNEIDSAKTPLTLFEKGELVNVMTSQGKTIAVGYINPKNLLAIRVLTKDPTVLIDEAFFLKQLKSALALRERFFSLPFYRLVYGESDRLPGLIVDRFGEVLVVQFNTAGMEKLRVPLLMALRTLLAPKTIIINHSSSQRALEQLEIKESEIIGELKKEIVLEENHAQFLVPLLTGQKTGWFYDHRDNRAHMQRYVVNKKVLDVFSYLGGWGILAALAGANEVVCVDRSKLALEVLNKNAALNKVADKVRSVEGEAFAVLKKLIENHERFDVVIVDPPAFIKKRKDIKAGELAYQRLNEMALSLLNSEGILITASCSLHFSEDMLIESVRKAAVKTKKNVQILEQGRQGLDHPIHPAIPETAYLKTLFCRVS